jgi:hypothetical protein
MKKVLPFLFAAIILSSCKKEQTVEVSNYPQKWELSSTIGGMIPGLRKNPPYAESYQLNADSTFTKRTEKTGSLLTVSGTFSVRGVNIVFTYPKYTEAINTFIFSTNEKMVLNSNNELYQDTGIALDGLGYIYQRIE